MISARRLVWAMVFLPAASAMALAAEPTRTRKLNYEPTKREWVELPPPPPGTAEGDLFRLRESVRAGDFRRSLDGVKRWVKTYGAEDPLYPEILLIRAEAWIGRGNFDHAFKALQEFINQFAGIALTSDALRLEFIVAESYLGGARRRFLGLPMFSGEDRAFQILDEIALDYPDDPLAPLAIKTKADYLFRRGEHDQAEMEYARLQREYPRSRYNQFAMRRAAESALAGFGGVEYDDSALIEAHERFQDYRVRYAAVADQEGVGLILDNIRELQAEKEFRIGAYYERTDHLSSAVFYYRVVLRDFPGTIAAGKAGRRLEMLGVAADGR
jgi:tetratricopeptide (TPR) repeat protein